MPFNESDALVIAELSYLPLEEVNSSDLIEKTLGEYMKEILEIWSGVQILWSDNKKSLYEMATLIEDNPRFSTLRLSDIQVVQSSLENTQFAGITVHIPQQEKEQIVVAFRGTDGSREGWMEDFMLAYADETNAQRLSVQYLTKIEENYEGEILIVGHSKGGNNAMYSFLAASSSVQDRVSRIYNFDGPSFRAEVLEKFGASYQAMLPKLTSYIPQSSMIGLLLFDHANIVNVRSDNKLILQHEAFSWEIEEDGNFLKNESGTDEVGQYVNQVLDDVVAGLNDHQRKVLVEVFDVYGIFSLIAQSPLWWKRKDWVASGLNDIIEYRKEFQGKNFKEIIGLCGVICSQAWKNYGILRKESKETISTALTVATFSLTHRFFELAQEKAENPFLFQYLDEKINGYVSTAYQKENLSVDTEMLEENGNHLHRVQNKIKQLNKMLNSYYAELIQQRENESFSLGQKALKCSWSLSRLDQFVQEAEELNDCICYLNIITSKLESAETQLCVKILEFDKL